MGRVYYGGVERTYLYRGRILNLALEGRYEIVEHKPAVAVIALREGRMLFVRQMRPAVGLAPLEIPAGLIEPGEDPLEAARRELAEETGLSGDLTYLFSYFVSPGFTDEKTHVFLAENLKEVEAHPDEDEAIEVVWMRPEEALERHQRGRWSSRPRGSWGSSTTMLFSEVADVPKGPKVVAVGSFDGVHLGHQYLLRQALSEAKTLKAPLLVYTFDPPTKVFTRGRVPHGPSGEGGGPEGGGGGTHPGRALQRGVRQKTPEAFLEDLRALQASRIYVGEDFRFGQGRAGGPEALERVAPTRVVPLLSLGGRR